MLPNPNPSSAFRFAVDIDGVTAAVFTECTLPNYEIETKEDLKEGGRTGYGLVLPGPFKPGKVSLKRGLVLADKMLDWYFSILNWSFAKDELYRTVVVTLYKGFTPSFTFEFRNAFPVKWVGPSLKADTTAIAIEQIDFAYESVSIEKGTVNMMLDIAAVAEGTARGLMNAASAVKNLAG
jgi:phage tail-like protein